MVHVILTASYDYMFCAHREAEDDAGTDDDPGHAR